MIKMWPGSAPDDGYRHSDCRIIRYRARDSDFQPSPGHRADPVGAPFNGTVPVPVTDPATPSMSECRATSRAKLKFVATLPRPSLRGRTAESIADSDFSNGLSH
jgi:hypothetical protein